MKRFQIERNGQTILYIWQNWDSEHMCAAWIMLTFVLLEQEPAGCYWCILWLWKPQCQHAIHVLRWRCDNWGRRVCASRYIVHKDLEDTKHRCVSLHLPFLLAKKPLQIYLTAGSIMWCFVPCFCWHCFYVFLNFRCRVVATWGLSQVYWWRSVWACKHSCGEVIRSTGNDRCERADAKSHKSGYVPGPVEDVYIQRTILWR